MSLRIWINNSRWGVPAASITFALLLTFVFSAVAAVVVHSWIPIACWAIAGALLLLVIFPACWLFVGWLLK